MKDIPTGRRYTSVKPKLIAVREQQHAKGKRFNRSKAAMEREAYYKTKEWKTLRAQVLREEPLCQMCGAPSEHVDHLEHGADWKAQFFDRANLRGLCARCHNSKSASDRAKSQARPSPYEKYRKPS